MTSEFHYCKLTFILQPSHAISQDVVVTSPSSPIFAATRSAIAHQLAVVHLVMKSEGKVINFYFLVFALFVGSTG